VVTVTGPSGTRTVSAARTGDLWSAPVALAAGETATIDAGGLRDALGETNAAPIVLATRSA
jgi:hypothetical protein